MGNRNRPITAHEFDALFDQLNNQGRWGADDRKGTLNYITPEKTRESAALVKSGRCVSMAIPISTMTAPDNTNPAIHHMVKTHDDDCGSINTGFAADFLGMQFHGDCHTHIDALCHVSYKGLLYNGLSASTVDMTGASHMDITDYAQGIVSRGVLIDAPRYRGIKWLEPGDAVTADEIEKIEDAQGIKLEQGDIMLLRTGQYRRRVEKGAWNVGYNGEGRAGLDPYSLLLLHERKVAAFLPEGDGEVHPAYVDGMRSPIHVLQMAAMGMMCADNLQLEELSQVCAQEGRYSFMVVVAPLRLPRGTGSPFNPIAVF